LLAFVLFAADSISIFLLVIQFIDAESHQQIQADLNVALDGDNGGQVYRWAGNPPLLQGSQKQKLAMAA
jgi:hypothetical protein